MVTVTDGMAHFSFYRPHAHQVFVVGDFNHWRPNQLPMSRTADGHWTASLRLKPGTYRFRYLADGEWFVDYAGFGVDHGPFGLNGVVYVPEPRGTSHRTPEGTPHREACRSCPYVVDAA